MSKKISSYDRAANDTKYFCYIGIFVGVTLAIISLICLIYFNFYYKDNYYKSTATVTQASDCGVSNICNMTIEYYANGKKYVLTKTYDISSNNNLPYNVGQVITIYIDKSNPKYIKMENEHINIGTLNIIFSVLLVIGILKSIFFYVFRRNPFVCGFYGLSWFLGRN